MENKITLSIKNISNNKTPQYESVGASGLDISAFLSEDVTIEPNTIKIIPTGLFLDIPKGFEVQVRPRSGLAAKHGLTVLNTPGTIDYDYTGEIMVILINHSQNDFIVSNGLRIAQMVLAPVITKELVNVVQVESIDKSTDRGSNKFGSTGLN